MSEAPSPPTPPGNPLPYVFGRRRRRRLRLSGSALATGLLLSLVCDGLVGGTQDRMKAGYTEKTGRKLQPYDLMMFTNLMMMVVALAAALSLDQFWGGVQFIQENPAVGSKVRCRMPLVGSLNDG